MDLLRNSPNDRRLLRLNEYNPTPEPGGRLTIHSNLPYNYSAETSATLQYLPYLHNHIWLFTGNRWTEYKIPAAGWTLDVSGWTNLTPYDVFVYPTDGSNAVLGVAIWTNASTRASAISTLDGRLVKASNYSYLLVGTAATFDSGVLKQNLIGVNVAADSGNGIYNVYNKEIVAMSNYYNGDLVTASASWIQASWRNYIVLGRPQNILCSVQALNIKNTVSTGFVLLGNGYAFYGPNTPTVSNSYQQYSPGWAATTAYLPLGSAEDVVTPGAGLQWVAAYYATTVLTNSQFAIINPQCMVRYAA